MPTSLFHHHLGVYELHLGRQIALARLDLLGAGVPVAGRAAFEDVADVDIVAADPDLAEQSIEQFPRCPHEGDALFVLVAAGRLANEHHFGGG